MTVEQLYRKAVQVGMDVDFRSDECLREQLAGSRRECDALGAEEQAGFDLARLENPYGDTRIINGPLDAEVTSVLLGIEIHGPELLMAAAMRQMGKPVDLVISHHVSCINRERFYYFDIVDIHKSSLAEVGADTERGCQLVEDWKGDLGRQWREVTPHFARHLDLPLMTIHTPADLCHRALRQKMAEGATVGQFVDAYNAEPEVQASPYAKTQLLTGDASRPMGTIYDPTGAGWRPRLDIFELGCGAEKVDTAFIVSPTAEYVEVATRCGVNLVEVPHDANDNIGLNLMLDALSSEQELTVHACHNFVRVDRRSPTVVSRPSQLRAR